MVDRAPPPPRPASAAGPARAALFAGALLAAGVAGPASAQGFAARDLSALGVRAEDVLGPGAIGRAAPERLTMLCPECPGAPSVDVLLGRQTDGTEGRVRSGETPMARLDEQCRAREASCRVERRDVGPAVGWVSAYRLGGTAGSTAVLLRDGDLLTVRALAQTPEAARTAVEAVLTRLAPRVVGR